MRVVPENQQRKGILAGRSILNENPGKRISILLSNAEFGGAFLGEIIFLLFWIGFT